MRYCKLRTRGFGLRVGAFWDCGPGFRAWDLGDKVSGLGFRAWDSGCRV